MSYFLLAMLRLRALCVPDEQQRRDIQQSLEERGRCDVPCPICPARAGSLDSVMILLRLAGTLGGGSRFYQNNPGKPMLRAGGPGFPSKRPHSGPAPNLEPFRRECPGTSAELSWRRGTRASLACGLTSYCSRRAKHRQGTRNLLLSGAQSRNERWQSCTTSSNLRGFSPRKHALS